MPNELSRYLIMKITYGDCNDCVTCQNFIFIKFMNFKDSRHKMRETSDFNRIMYKGTWDEGLGKDTMSRAIIRSSSFVEITPIAAKNTNSRSSILTRAG